MSKQNYSLIQLNSPLYYNKMAHLNRSGEKAQRVCTTPERMKLVESIKKSIHRSIQKINPNDYKNILKGEYIFMHLCHGGQIINSQYTKVALFMGAAVFKKALQKVTVVVTNESSNKTVKKLAGMGKPILSVLWLEACFQQKRKVEYESFLFQQLPNNKNEDQKQQQISVNFEALLNLHKQQVDSFEQEFMSAYNHNFLRFVDKKQKIDTSKYEIIPIHDIQIKLNYPNIAKTRKSQAITHKQPKKKNVTKKVQFKSEGTNKPVSLHATKLIESENSKEELKQQNQNIKKNVNQQQMGSYKQRSKLSKSIYEKYLKDYNNFETKVQKQEKIQQVPLKVQQNQTPCFVNISHKHQNERINQPKLQTPTKVQNIQQNEELYRTYSIKKTKNNNFKVSIVHPIISQQVENINQSRQGDSLPLIQIVGSDMRNTTWVISHESKIEAILALLSEPKIIVNQGFIKYLQDHPCSQITDDLLSKYQVKYRLNSKSIEGKKILLLDSVMGASSLEKIIKKCRASIVSSRDYLLGGAKVDITITNKKNYMKNPNDIVMSEANFIDSLIFMQNK